MKKQILFLLLLFFAASMAEVQAQTELWGMTSGGGDNNDGVIFKTNGNGEIQQILPSFIIEIPGDRPTYTTLFEASNGKLYGMTASGGAKNMGVLYEYDPNTDTYTKKLDFAGATNGSVPSSSLIRASNGKLYGMTASGGAYNLGVIFVYDPGTNVITKKIDFAGATNGSTPLGSLMEASNGKLYGMTRNGGANNVGVIFEYDPGTNVITKKIDFAGATNGSYPYGSLMEASNGKLYGMTSGGGTSNKGVLFEYDPTTNTYTRKIDFAGAANGSTPYGSLMRASNEKLYGMTYGGGSGNRGVLFEFDPITGFYTKKIDFTGTSNGQNPRGSLMQASNGKLYGMTSIGGANNLGVLFEYDPVINTCNKKLDFAGATNGSNPYSSLMEASNGKLYGITYAGGFSDRGVLFELDPGTNEYNKKIDFNIATSGSNPTGSLLQASNGKLYGMTFYGGANNQGVIFEYDPATNVYTKKNDFGGANGTNPYGSLIEASNGKLYGMTNGGGANNLGVMFEYDPVTSTYTKKFDFAGATNGSNPFGTLIEASNGKLYGMAPLGGANGFGVIFEYDLVTNAYTKKYDFDVTNGRNPYGSLMQASNGILYGVTVNGGANSMGVLFEYDPVTSTYTKKFDFDGATSGKFSRCSLRQASNGKLYGMTNGGGSNDMGVLFEYDITTNAYIKKLDFAGATNGSTPYGSLVQASNEKLYGMTSIGGANNMGVLFEYDPNTDTYNKKLDFNGTNGSKPYYTHLIEINLQPATVELAIAQQPEGSTVCTGGSHLLTVVAEGTGYTFAYQWQYHTGIMWKNATGFTSSTLLTNPPYTRSYRVVVTATNNQGSVKLTSNPAVVTVVSDPTITSQPVGRNICSGGSHTLTVIANGGSPSLNYQWQSSSNGTAWGNISGQTDNVYQPVNITATMYYRCQLSATASGCNTIYTLPVLVTVYDDPLLQISSDYEFCVGESAYLILTSLSGGCGARSYQWQYNDDGFWRAIEGATTYKLTVSPDETTEYRLAYTAQGNGCNTAYSNVVTVTVHPDTFITEQPVSGSLSKVEALGFTLNVVAEGGMMLSYQWQYYFNNVWSNIPGATFDALVVDPPYTRSYRVKITSTGLGCNTVYSNVATVTVGGAGVQNGEILGNNQGEYPVDLLPEATLLTYPNPFNDVLSISLEDMQEGPIRIELYDIYGRKVNEWQTESVSGSCNKELQLGSLSTGMYVLRVYSGNQVIVSKVQKQ